MTAIAIYFISLHHLGLSVWVWVFLFFTPDIGMLGYLINTRIGAVAYNLFHHKAVVVAVIAIGYFLKNDAVELYGLIMLAHSSFDRVLGFGLKYPDDFKHTSLGYT